MRSWMIGLVAGIVSVGYWPVLPAWPYLVVPAVVVASVLLRPSPAAILIGGVALGSALGVLHGTLLLQSRIVDPCVGQSLVVDGTVSSLPRISPMRGQEVSQRFEFTVAELSPGECQGPKTLLLSYYGKQQIQPGDQWQFTVKLKKPWGLANPGVYNLQAWFAQNGIDAVGSVRETGQLPLRSAQAPGLRSLPDRLRQRISGRISSLPLDPDTAAILRAVCVADSSGIEPRLWFLFQQFGLNHLLVISGLHVGMVAAVGYVLGACCLRMLSPVSTGAAWIPPAVALLLACCYGALAGLTLPVQRALCMLACFVIASLGQRQGSSATSLLLAATGVLLLNPLAGVGSGFWLSFGAVGALIWFTHWQRGLGSARRLLQTQASMSLFMLPLGALFFGGGSLVAVVANIVMIPLVGWVVVPLALLAAVCFLCGWDVAATLWALAGWPLATLLPLAHGLADRADGWLYLPLSADLGLVLLAVLAVALLVLPGLSALKLLALLMAVPVLLPLDRVSRAPSLNTEVTVLDVGQGTAVVVRSGNRALLYDTGGGDPQGVNMGSLAVLPYLQHQGITALDTLVISHPDLDHSAGTAVVRNALPVSRLRYGGVESEKGAANEAYGGAGRACIAGESWRWPGGQVFQFLSPSRELPRRSNDSSCVLLLQVGNYRLLLPGDIEADRERILVQYWGEYLASDWLMAAHHGSNTSSTTTFLKHVQAQVVVLSNGYANRFRHPHAQVIERLGQQDVSIFSTATDGAVALELTAGQTVQISAYRDIVRRYWM